jgi:hypothetical protein
MPIICSHLSRDAYTPGQAWLDTTLVQWGSRGIVLGANPYTTAFFEAFPKDGGFIRGEGETIHNAEVVAFAKWCKENECALTGGHRWSRTRRGTKPSTYTNGGCFCLRCHAFSTVMKPIAELGDYKKPLDVMALEAIALGCCRYDDKYSKKLKLRAKLAGIDLPADFDSDYIEKCTIVTGRYYAENKDRLQPLAAASHMEHFFQTMAVRYLTAIEAC